MMRVIGLLLALALVLTLTACGTGAAQDTSGTAADAEQRSGVASSTPDMDSAVSESDDQGSSWSNSETSRITLEGNSITLDGSGAIVEGNIVTVTSAGTYSISGTLDDGQIIVNAEDQETVNLVLNGAEIVCSTSAPIYVSSADEAVITLADGTENYVTDGGSYTLENAESGEPSAAIFSMSDLTINGGGSLTVSANYNNGIQSKDDLEITGGNITVDAINDGIKGRDSIAVGSASVTVNAGGDGMRSDNDEDPERGCISIEGGTLDITAGADGIQAETSLTVSGGDLTISSGGGSGNAWGNWGASDSAKGLKAGVNVTITGGTINIDSSDDSIHSNDSLTISSGSIVLASGDDGIHSDSSLQIDGGDISITKSYEAIESAVVTINDGTIHLVASDDGINVVGGVDGSSINGRPGQNNFAISGNNHLYINGGYVAINATGDGLDINGPINMSGGVVIINGPTRNDNGALDYLGTFEITGGFLVAVGSSGMAEAPSASSTQYSVMLNLSPSLSAGTMIHIGTEDGEEILTFVPTKAYQSVVLSSPELKNGSTYVVYSGGSSTGTVTDGLYSGGTYAAGTQLTSFATSSVVTIVGSSGGGFPGGMPGRTRP